MATKLTIAQSLANVVHSLVALESQSENFQRDFILGGLSEVLPADNFKDARAAAKALKADVLDSLAEMYSDGTVAEYTALEKKGQKELVSFWAGKTESEKAKAPDVYWYTRARRIIDVRQSDLYTILKGIFTPDFEGDLVKALRDGWGMADAIAACRAAHSRGTWTVDETAEDENSQAVDSEEAGSEDATSGMTNEEKAAHMLSTYLAFVTKHGLENVLKEGMKQIAEAVAKVEA